MAKQHSPGFLKVVDAAKAKVREVTVTAVAARCAAGEVFHLIDVREESEFAADRCAGARYIGRGVLERDIEALIPDRSADIVLYCGGGYRSALAADMLQQMGYTNVASMDGGIRGWREGNHPLES